MSLPIGYPIIIFQLLYTFPSDFDYFFFDALDIADLQLDSELLQVVPGIFAQRIIGGLIDLYDLYALFCDLEDVDEIWAKR